jgi:hypothetical protein
MQNPFGRFSTGEKSAVAFTKRLAIARHTERRESIHFQIWAPYQPASIFQRSSDGQESEPQASQESAGEEGKSEEGCAEGGKEEVSGAAVPRQYAQGGEKDDCRRQAQGEAGDSEGAQTGREKGDHYQEGRAARSREKDHSESNTGPAAAASCAPAHADQKGSAADAEAAGAGAGKNYGGRPAAADREGGAASPDADAAGSGKDSTAHSTPPGADREGDTTCSKARDIGSRELATVRRAGAGKQSLTGRAQTGRR